MGIPYNPPQIDRSKVRSLLPAHRQKQELKPDTLVTCLNRGPRRLVDMFDAEEYVIEPYMLFEVTFACAKHFQNRLIVPGTRNPNPADTELPQSVSWIAILGVDPPQACEPFDPALLERFGEKVEGLNRDALPSADRDVQIASTADLRRLLPGAGAASSVAALAMAAGHDVAAGAGGGGGLGLQQQIVGGSDEKREAALAPVETSDASAAVAEAIASGTWAPPDESQIVDRSAPTPEEVVARATGTRGGRRR